LRRAARAFDSVVLSCLEFLPGCGGCYSTEPDKLFDKIGQTGVYYEYTRQ
jgi:hypothetical protein